MKLSLILDNPREPAGTKRYITWRQLEVGRLAASGKANKQIASHLRISIKTVEKHRTALYGIAGCHEVTGLIRWLIKSGHLDLQEWIDA